MLNGYLAAKTTKGGDMSFSQRHPYLFWQLVGWGLMLVDFAFLAVAALNDFGEWSYPIIVFTFIAALFAIIGSPFFVYWSCRSRLPQTSSETESRVIRNDITSILMLRKTTYTTMVCIAVVALVIGLAYVTYMLGEYGHVLLGFVSMVFMVVIPFIACERYLAFVRKRFIVVKDAAQFVRMRDAYYLSDLRSTRMPILPLPSEPSDAMLDFLYNWLRRYLMSSQLTLISVTRADLRRVGIVLVGNSEAEDGLEPNGPLIAIPEHQLDLSGANRAQFDKECKALGAFGLPTQSQTAGICI